MAEVQLDQWNEFLGQHPEAHFLQAGEWGELKSQFGWTAVRLIVGDSGIQLLFRHLPLGYTIAYIPKPSLTQMTERHGSGLWSEVDALCLERRAILCKFEPDIWEGEDSGALGASWLIAGHTVRLATSPHNVQPRRTLLVDLMPAEDTVLNRMKQKCRYNIRLAEKKGVRVRSWADIAGFHAMLVGTGARDQFAVHSAAYYRRAYELFHPTGMCELMVAEYEGQPLAALMVFARGRRAWYVYGGSSDAERERMPNYLLQWEAMRWAKSRGCAVYDLWGVPDEDENVLETDFTDRSDGLWGVYRFKRGFGGELRRAMRAYDRVYNPLLYRVYLMRTSPQDGQ